MIEVKEVSDQSLGQRAGLASGDRILEINGEKIGDLIDFQVNSAEADLLIAIERDGEVYEIEVERQPGEDMGLEFEEMRLRSCNNKCVFCFIHQMPKGMRRSLYFEDDDYRLSFLHGSYVTLTNIKDRDLDRIVEQGLSPQYLSVHATDPDLRQTLLGRTKPTGNILERIEKLAQNNIEMHCQVVLCPGLNDGAHLVRTVEDLSRFYPAVRSVALVPVGLTRHRDKLPQLQGVSPQVAAGYLKAAQAWGRDFKTRLGERLVYLADELFLLNGRLPPPASYYDAFPQIENGIGMVRSFLDRWERGKKNLPQRLEQPLHLGLVTGKLAAFFMEPICQELNRIGGLSVDLVPVANRVFGAGITVSGLLAGSDILDALAGGRWDLVLLPPNTVNGEGLTLDDLTVAELADKAAMAIGVGDYDLAKCLAACFSAARPALLGWGRQLSELGYYVGRK